MRYFSPKNSSNSFNHLEESNLPIPNKLEKARRGRIVEGQKTIGVLDLHNHTINALISNDILHLSQLKNTQYHTLRSFGISQKTITELEEILQSRDPNFSGFFGNTTNISHD